MSMYYILDNNKIWDTINACFIESLPELANCSYPTTNKEESHNIEGLRNCLRYFNFPLGELKEDSDYAIEVRNKRNKLLSSTDYLIMPDYPLNNSKRDSILTYRQTLRDITKQEGFPRNVIWPEKTWE